LADQGADALWFEGRSLTYGEMKRSKTISPEQTNPRTQAGSTASF